MNRFKSSITFLYYKNFEEGCKFIEEVLDLELVMDQGFARVYKISETSFLGAVKKSDSSISPDYKGGTLVSLNTSNVIEEHQRVKKLNVNELSEIKFFEEIPLRSFFFKDDELHDFEIQEFIDLNDKVLFKVDK